MLDDTPRKLARHYGNLVPIRPFDGNTDGQDTELALLPVFLDTLKDCENVRKIKKRGWRRHPAVAAAHRLCTEGNVDGQCVR